MKGDCHADPQDWLWLRVRKLQQIVANYFGVPAAELRGDKRSTAIAACRRYERFVQFENPDALKLRAIVRQRLEPDPHTHALPDGDRFIDELVRAGVRKP